MPWSDDTRCLFCDGKLPLYRKLTQGQFCSRAHQDAYWKEQQELAVESLHQTHDALRAYRPAEPIENILGPLTPSAPPLEQAPATRDLFLECDPAFAGLLSQREICRPVWTGLPSIITADPLEYEVTARPTVPRANASLVSVSTEVSETLAALASLKHISARQAVSSVPASSAVLDCYPASSLIPSIPASRKSPVAGLSMGAGVALPASSVITSAPPLFESTSVAFSPVLSVPASSKSTVVDLAMGSRVALAGSSAVGSIPRHAEPKPLTVAMQPLYELALSLVPAESVIDRLELDQFPPGETLLPLPALQAVASTARGFESPEFCEGQIPACRPSLSGRQRVSEFALPQATQLEGLKLGGPISLPVAMRGAGDSIEPSIRTQTAVVLPYTASYTPALAEPVSLPETFRPQAAAGHHAAGHPIAFHALPAKGTMTLPTWPASNWKIAAYAPQVKVRAEQVFRLNFQQKMTPRDCALRLRTACVMATMPGHDEPLLPKARLEPVTHQTGFESLPSAGHFAASIPSKVRSMAAGAAGFWSHAPRDLKILLFAVPIALTLAFHPSLPKVSVRAPQGGTEVSSQFKQVVNTQFASLKKSMAQRAAVGLDEDFRQGLDSWTSRSGNVAEWSFDQAGSVLPGKVALYAPSLRLTDYEMQFLGMIDKGALSWVVRASDFDNCYVVKLVVVKPGPVPQMGLTRYAVIHGQAVDRVDTPVMLSARSDSLYRVDMNVQGNNYSLTIQGQMIDSWTETRLKKGGVGFFTSGGEKSRVRWMQITHQYDMLGRLFAYLAPYDISNTSGGW
ncbi:MAG: hypothetical protein ABI811_23795 [Acidobacteriota bacterium]